MRKNVFNFYKKAIFTLALAMLINLHLKAQTYCSSNFTSVSFEHITNVTFAGINNTSVGTVGGPVDYTSQVATVNVGVPSTLSVTILADASEYIYAFIDWNQDGDFSDSEEVYTVATSVATSGPFTLAITPPNAATPGTTRMRVMLDFAGSTPNPCKSGTYGEAEDYTVNVVTSPCVAPPTAGNATSSKINACSGENFNLSLTGNSLGSGQTYKWQYSLTGNAPWTDVSLAQVSPSFSTNQNISTYYRCMVTCSGNSVYSDSIQVITPALVGGTFTINGALPTGGGNFASFAEAIDYIKCGINGPVVFNVAVGSGPYALSAPLNIPVIYGATSTNTVTINGNGESITYNTVDANNRAAIVLNGTDHLILDSLTIDVSAGTYGYGMVFKSNADSNIIRKSTILNNLTATTTNYAGIVFSSLATSATTAGSNGNDNLIENNRIVGGYYGITIVGAGTTDLDSNNVIRNNSIEEFYAYGIYTLYQKDATIKSNHIHRPTRTNSGSCYGIYSSTGGMGLLIEGNRIHNTFAGQTSSTSTFYGIYMFSDATATSPNKIINNLIYNNEGNGAHYGIYNSGAAYMQIYHNTIALDYVGATAGATYGFYQITSDIGMEFKNNIVYITRGGTGVKYGIYKSTAATPLESNNNVFYLGSAGSGAQSIGFQTSAQASLANWQSASSQDASSVVADPLFVNPSVGNYMIANASIDNFGVPVGVLKDINDSTRSSSSPDAGAYEYTPPPCVAPPTAGTVTSSAVNVCTGDNFSLNLVGNSVGTGQTYKWQYSLTGNAPWTDVDTENTSPIKSLSQSVSRYYRCVVTCSGNSVYTDSLQVISPVLINGTYTINSALPTSGSNFATFAEAFDYIKCGINGPVVFNVAVGSGPYALSAPLNIPVIYGATSTNTVTINGNGESITYNTVDANNRSAIVLNGTDHLILDSLTIDVSAGTYGVGIQFMNNADSNIVRKSTILTNTSATSTNYAGIIFSGSPTSATTAGSNGNDNLIENNRIVGGYYSITLVGTSTTDLDSNNVIKGNLLEDFYFYGIYTLYQKNATIKSNNISRPLRTTVSSFYPVYLSTGNIGSLVEGNKIHNGFTGAPTSTSAMYGIYCTSDGTLTSPNLIVNNLIYNNEGNGAHYGIYNSGAAYMQVYHNTIALDYTSASAGATYGFYQVTSDNGIEFKNNIVYITRGGTGAKYGIYKGTAATPLVSNNNIFYLGSAGSGAQSIGYQTSAQASLTAWQTASSQDVNSMVADPLFTNPSVGDYKPTETSIDNKGASLGVLRDILDTIRPLILPDLGAYEFGTMPSPCSATPVPGNTVSSVPIACPNSNFTLSLEFPPSELGLTFQWQSADDAAFTTNVVDLGTASTQATSQTSAKYYRCKVTCTNSGLFAYSTPIFIDINSWINCYCTPATTGGTTYYISGFTTTGGSTNINKTTSAGSVSGYQDFYATDEVTINKGDVLAYTINVAGGSTYGYAIWIDFNQDGTFQATEQVLTTSSYASSPKTGTVTIPNTAVVGSTRVRVLATFSPSNPSDPCNNSGSGEYQDYAITIQQPVPVTYTMFTGKREGMVNMLSWQTATESNNIGFELQRSSDGKQFSKLSFVNSKAINGNSTSNLSYGYNDVKPLAGTNYYRLKQVDKDGKFNYSTVVILKGDKVSQISIASVYPNPVRNTINVQIVSPANEKVSLVITDITGKVLMQENTSLTAGDNVKQIDVSRLSQGAYLIKAICNNGCETAVFKFTKY